MTFIKILLFSFIATLFLSAQSCKRLAYINALIINSSLKSLQKYPDIARNYRALQELCVDQISFREGQYSWKMLLVTHPKYPKGAFWFLPHDDEQSAFDAAVYATRRYGGGFLAIMAGDKRYFAGQDPNRNFGSSTETAQRCRGQESPAPIYSKVIFSIIDTYRGRSLPYLALHNNKDGFGGDQGTISILKSSINTPAYPAYKEIRRGGGGLNDEDSLVYIAGLSKTPNHSKLKRLLQNGINTKYERVSPQSNDCSLSNFVVLSKKSTDYYNIETEHGDLKTQMRMIDILMKIIK